jgi:excisionase family DNA binding protein
MEQAIAIEGLISLRDAAKLIGCSTITVRRMAARGDLPVMKLPGSRLVRLRRTALQRVIESSEAHHRSSVAEGNAA